MVDWFHGFRRATNYWARNCDVHQRACEPMRRINATMLTDYNPITWPAPWGLAAGEGSFTYPGADGPIATLRIKAMRDGIEDVRHYSFRTSLALVHLRSCAWCGQELAAGAAHSTDR